MKLLIFGDLQATEGTERCFTRPDVPLQRYRITRFFEVLHDIYVDHGCDGLIDLGDMLDDRSSVPVPTISTVLAGLDPFNGWNIKLIGNHEQYVRDGRIHSGKLFEHKFTVVDETAVFQVPDSDTFLAFASFPGSHKELVTALENIIRDFHNKNIVLFGHFQVIGCQLTSGLAYDGVPRDVLMPFNEVFLGHIHKPQTMSDKIHYVGSPFQQNFGESGEEKRVAIFDTETLRTEWVPITGFPKYRTVNIDQFLNEVDEQSEDRYHVMLTSQAEAEKFFAHPLCTRADPDYAYAVKPQESAGPVNQQAWSFESVLCRYLEKESPANAGISISNAEMLEIGAEIARGSE